MPGVVLGIGVRLGRGWGSAGAGTAPFAQDVFVGTAGTDLLTHTSDSGHSWASIGAESTRAIQFTDANRVRKSTTAAGVAAYVISATPPNANYKVDGTFRVLTDNDSAGYGVIGRASTATGNYYMARYNTINERLELHKRIAGVFTLIGTAVFTPSLNTDYKITLEMNGTTIRLLLEDAQQLSVTDADIAAAGQVGLRFVGDSGDTVGIHLDNLLATAL